MQCVLSKAPRALALGGIRRANLFANSLFASLCEKHTISPARIDWLRRKDETGQLSKNSIVGVCRGIAVV
jgi:hypothetical protein